jgi:signal peptidase I
MEEDKLKMSSVNHHTPLKIQGNRFRFTDFLSTFLVVVVALVLALALITYVFQSYQVDGPSMENTLQNNDRLIVWKVARTWSRVTGHPYIPNRGDIVVFNESGLAAYGQTNTKQLIKRVIGLPGDHVVIKNGAITIYNKTHPNGFDPDTALLYGKTHPLPYTAGNIDITLGKNQIFVCGDNRTDSLDSRIFGPVNVNNIIGKLVLRIYPFSSFKAF